MGLVLAELLYIYVKILYYKLPPILFFILQIEKNRHIQPDPSSHNSALHLPLYFIPP